MKILKLQIPLCNNYLPVADCFLSRLRDVQSNIPFAGNIGNILRHSFQKQLSLNVLDPCIRPAYLATSADETHTPI